MKALAAALAGAATLAVSLSFVPKALACGGCFVPPSSPTVVSGHRMAMSISKTQTVLWDQIQYQGDPEEFAWVLPVKPGARIEEATDAFFEVLEATTSTTVTGPSFSCGGGDSGCGFGCGDDAEAGSDGGYYDPASQVDVVHQGSVGPYETVTLSTSTPGALNAWLEDHGYNVDAASQPVIDQYVAEGFDFIALRLQPGQGVLQMSPVRVVMPGGGLTLPLRMVAIGTGAETPLVLYLIGEGRYTLDNLTEVNVPSSLVVWDYETSTSNYQAVRKSTLEQNDGLSFLTTYARPGILTAPPQSGPSTSTLLSLYQQQAIANGEALASCKIQPPGGDLLIGNPCPDGPLEGGACTGVPVSQIDARLFGCPGAYDISMAVMGMVGKDVWVTRVEANLPRAALASDLTIRAGAQTQVSNQFVAGTWVNREKVCPNASSGATWGEPPRTLRVAPYLIGTAALVLLLRRRARAAQRRLPSFQS
jgi:hypothetical protein